MNKPIKKYTQRGEIRDDSDFWRLRTELERLLVQQMRADGCLPIHDLGSFWSTKLLDKKYSFVLTMYAAYVGRRKSKQYDFWLRGRLVKDG
jgi:hypothetical protein